MSSDPLLGLPEIDPNQTGKTVTMNTMIAAIAQATSATLTIAANSNPTPYTIPFQATTDEPAGVKTALRSIWINVTGALSAAWTALMPSGGFTHLFIVTNNTTGNQTLTFKVTGGTGVAIPPGATVLCYLNGTDVQGFNLNPPALTSPYDLSSFFSGLPGNSQIMVRLAVPRSILLPSGLPGSTGSAAVAATASTVFQIQRNGGSIGTATFAASATTATFSFTSAVTFVAGDIFSITGPATADATLASIGFAISGFR